MTKKSTPNSGSVSTALVVFDADDHVDSGNDVLTLPQGVLSGLPSMAHRREPIKLAEQLYK